MTAMWRVCAMLCSMLLLCLALTGEAGAAGATGAAVMQAVRHEQGDISYWLPEDWVVSQQEEGVGYVAPLVDGAYTRLVYVSVIAREDIDARMAMDVFVSGFVSGGIPVIDAEDMEIDGRPARVMDAPALTDDFEASSILLVVDDTAIYCITYSANDALGARAYLEAFATTIRFAQAEE